MIYDSLVNFGDYLCLHPHFKSVYTFIKENNTAAMAEGKYEVNNQGAFVLISEYNTKEISEGFIECHRKYIDIQILLEGRERIGICNILECKEYPYDPDKDLQKLAGEVSFIKMVPKHFVIFFPRDGHMTQIKCGDFPQKVRKVVFKVPILSLTS
ncbi:MAG: YhcH/YjgK/YiaL family protein [Proteobacteria bacterium]|nr:YhcH/YjgK/YiaL family protein [Pseudomonadota bacterium]